MTFCPICGQDVSEEVERRDKFPLTALRDVLCDWCLKHIMCYPIE